MGSTCATLKSFFSLYAAGKTLSNFLEFVEENVHANVRSTFGGAGGDRAAAVDAILKSQYALTDEHLFYVAEASHKVSNVDPPYSLISTPPCPPLISPLLALR